KAILRSDAGRGIALLPAETEVEVLVKDSHGEEVDKRTVKVGEWSSAEWVVEGRYLFGSPMAGREVGWTYTRSELYTLPKAIEEAFPPERWDFIDEEREDHGLDAQTIRTTTEALDEQGRRVLDLETDVKAGRPLTYALEGEVTDLSRQTLAGRA